MESRRHQRYRSGWSFKSLYVSILLRLLPHLINLTRAFDEEVRGECTYLPDGFVFMIDVEGTRLECVVLNCGCETMRHVPESRRASGIEPGSGLHSTEWGKVATDYVISFRSLDYAYACFSGGMSLQEALAARAFSTRGPNDAGVSLTYLFTALLRRFFFWRAPYRAKGRAAVRP